MRFSCALFFVVGRILTINGITLLESNILVEKGGSFFQRVTDTDLQISKCSISFPINYETKIIIVDLDLYSTNAMFPDDFQDTTDLKRRLHSIGSGFCGCKIDDITFEDPTKWTMQVTSENEITEATFNLGVYSPVELHSIQETSLGTILYIYCGNAISSPTYCHMYNPRGELVYRGNSCSYSTATSSAEDLGIWRCTLGATPYIKPLEFTVEVIDKATIHPEKWVNETDTYVSLGCTIKDCCTKTPDHCIMTSPTGEKFRIRPGSATERHTSLLANLKGYTCALEIQKPLLYSENGAWTCEINNRGVFLQVGQTRDLKGRTFSSSTTTELGKPFHVSCKLPYATSHCFITSPAGERHNPKEASRSELGECSCDINSALSEHNGTWTCSFFRDDDVVAIEKTFEVFVRNVMDCSLEVSAEKGQDATLFCNTGKAPLEYCWFSSPTGKTYQLKDGVETPEISYVGKGLDHGECGIKIVNAQDEHLGNWTCIMKIGTSEKVYTVMLDLSSSVVPLAAGLGAGLGALVIVFAVIGYLLYRRYKRKSLQVNSTNT